MRSYDQLMETRIKHLNAERDAKLERSRLTRAAMVGRVGRDFFYKPLLVSVGRRMVVWGTRLQRRYAASGYLSDLELQFFSE